MKKILKWIKEHVQPFCRVNKIPDEIINVENENNIPHDLQDLKDRTEVGIKITFKF